jgi:hypothetical protein
LPGGVVGRRRGSPAAQRVAAATSAGVKSFVSIDVQLFVLVFIALS